MHVLISGGAGFIGSHVSDALLARGDRVSVLDSLAPRVHPTGSPPNHLDARVSFMRGEVTDKPAWERALVDVDAVIHLAAYQDYQPDFGRFAMVNDGGTALLYEVIVHGRLPVRKLVVASSQAVYGEGAYHCVTHGTVYPGPRPLSQLERGAWELRCPICDGEIAPMATDESHPHPHNAYAISKVAQEMYALVLGERYAIPTVCLRYSIVQGSRQSPANAYSGVLRAFTSRLLQGLPPVAFEDGQQLRDYTHINDVVSATVLALDDDRANFNAFNVGSGETITVLAFGRLLARALGVSIEPEVGGRFRVGDTRHVWSDTSKLRALGWSPRYRIADNVADYVAALDRTQFAVDWAGRALAEMERAGTVRRVEG